MKTWIPLLLASAVLFPQTQRQSGRPAGSGGSVTVSSRYGYPVYGDYGGATSGTGDRLRGQADLIRAQGDAISQVRVSTAQAARESEEARARNIENRKLATEAYFEMRRINQEAQLAEAELRRRRLASSQARVATKAPRPSPVQVDPLTGKVHWPKALSDDMFAESRQKLDKMFEDRAAADGFIGAEGSKQIQQSVEAARDLLKENIKQFSSQDYVTSSKFLDSLELESRFAGR